MNLPKPRKKDIEPTTYLENQRNGRYRAQKVRRHINDARGQRGNPLVQARIGRRSHHPVVVHRRAQERD